MTNELQQLILESTDRVFADLVDKEILDKAETGEFPQYLWNTICENGFHQLSLRDSDAPLADSFAVIRQAGYYAVPVPLAEAMLGNRWLNSVNDEFVSIGLATGTGATGIPWAAQAQATLAVAPDNSLFKLEADQRSLGSNIAFEPRDTLQGQLIELPCEDAAFDLMALSRICLSAGALNRVLEMTIQYVGEREQFGRPISKFQAVQHNLAACAAEVAAATRACDGAMESIGDERFHWEVAAAKGRIGEATTMVTEAVHQLHGARGFTH